ncbi:MAG: hypothetical protein ACI4EU_01215 [Butyrivibrio sp.]
MAGKKDRPSKKLIIFTAVVVLLAVSLFILQLIVDHNLEGSEAGTETIVSEMEGYTAADGIDE